MLERSPGTHISYPPFTHLEPAEVYRTRQTQERLSLQGYGEQYEQQQQQEKRRGKADILPLGAKIVEQAQKASALVLLELGALHLELSQRA
eukprot:IDg23269t1